MTTCRIGTPSPSGAPRILDNTLARYPAALRPPEPHTYAELTCLLALLRVAKADTIAVGHGRGPVSVTAARALASTWVTAGSTVLAMVDWPASAASWPLAASTRATKKLP